MARNKPEEPTVNDTVAETETPAVTTGGRRVCNVMGIKYTLTKVPQTAEEYDAAAGKVGSCLERSVSADQAHKFNNTARSTIIETIKTKYAAEREANPELPALPEQGEKETDKDYFDSLVAKNAEGVALISAEFLAALPPIEIEYSFGSTRSTGPNAQLKKVAEAVIAKFGGDLNKVVEALTAKGYPCEPNLDSIAIACDKRAKDL